MATEMQGNRLRPHMRQTILSVAYPLTPVGPDAVGGSEQILTLLDSALTKAGHESIVIAAEGSRVSGRLIPSPPAGRTLDDHERLRGQHAHQRLIAETLRRYSVDLVHMHSLDFHSYLPDSSIPILATLHLPPDWYPSWIFEHDRPNFYLNCVSSSQQKACPSSRQLLPYVPNGVPVRSFVTKSVRKDYVLGLGRICPEKGFHFALKAAKMSGSKFLLAGEVFPYAGHLQYFEHEIKPHLDRKRQFIGPVGMARKRHLLSEARCLLVPSTVAETSSLVAMEALAAGTPVVAFASGALPEIIAHGRNGFVVKTVKEMAAAIDACGALDREECRRTAASRFCADQMAKRYFETYSTIIQNARTSWNEPVHSTSSWLVSW
jgi:glycosyltransferase involved in cell wall biosynthesis